MVEPNDANTIKVSRVGELMQRMEEPMGTALGSLGYFVQRKHGNKAVLTLPELYDIIYLWALSIWEEQEHGY